MEKGTLSVVATPIGNLGDITLRALETLKQVDTIACEDTRVTAKLLARYGIEKPLLIYNANTPATLSRVARAGDTHRPRKGADAVLALLAEGKHVALVTDAGTPGISDPGTELVREVKSRLGESVRIEAIPGPSAITAALSIAGVYSSEFVFLGFLPHKKGRQTLFKEIGATDRAVVFYESPHRIEKALASLIEVLAPLRQVVVCRELTKMFESVISGTATEVAEYFKKHPKEVRGEFVVVVGH